MIQSLKKLQLVVFLMLIASTSAFAQITKSGVITADETWTASNTYLLDGVVFVAGGATLTIEPGTIIYGATGQGNNASALVITQYGTINANGTADNPIIFTSEKVLTETLDETDRGEWGGVVMLGSATTNNSTDTKLIEGINEIATADSLAQYGGDLDTDNSGVFRYVSIRHTGINVGDQAGNEIQGLTLGGVGSGTTIEYVESFASGDDGFEWFGGTVNAKYLVSAFNADDSYDWDEGFRGKGQFWFAIQATDLAGRVAEMDGATGNENGAPFAHPVLSNVTFIGAGVGATPEGDGEQLLIFRDNTGGEYYNSVFTQYDDQSSGLGLTVEDIDNTGDKPLDSRQRFEAGDIILQNNFWFDFGAGNAITEFSDQDFVQTYLADAANGNRVEDPVLRGVSRTDDAGLDPRPGSGSPLWAAGSPIDDDWFDDAFFAGAFNTDNWMIGWTALSEYGYLDETVDSGTDINVSGVITEDTFWSNENSYFLDGVVFVAGGATLTIEPGTTVYGREGQGNNASALVITQEGTINANGTAENPIIFTSEKALTETLDETDRGEWGGVVMLGSASTNNSTELKQVEGINEIATDPLLAQYGGSEDDDNSGIFRYVSIRHTGINVGDQAGNEIQGLTLGGVGSGTVIEYVESFASGDDGFEWFGGTVNTKYLVSAFNADDSYDWDEGFRGKGQFWFAIQATDLAGRVAEMDGATGNENGEPYAKPILSNVTYIGAGVGATPEGDGEQMLIFRDNTGGEYHNSVFTQYDDQSSGLGITVEDIDNSGDKPLDSRQRFEAGDIVLQNNFWYDFGAGNEITQFSDQDFVQTYLADAANGNRVEDPVLRGISRTNDAGLDPRPGSGSPLWAGASPLDDDWFDEAYFAGAFNTENWMIGWTALSEYGYLDETVDSGTDINVAGVITEDTFWSAENSYFLDGVVFVTNNATLTIEPGTTIYGREGQGNNASALVVTQGANINANATAENPIIFTSEKVLTETLDETDRGEWGGVVILGRASTNNSTELKQVEGINEIATDEALAQYGGGEDDDNSGVFRYVSIRHTGINVGDQAGNEIQGLTLGGVGSGTVIEYVESFASGDDGFEWFGGTVNAKYLVSAFNADDSYDWDEGFRGKGQFWFAIQATDLAGRVAEMDGATGNENGEPFAHPILSNVTYIGAGVGATPEGDGEQMLIFRDNTGGEYHNSVFTQYDDQSSGLGITVEDIDNSGSKPLDSRQRFESGDIVLQNNFWFDFGAGNAITEFSDQDFVQTYLADAANGNRVEDPVLRGVSRTDDAGLDPRPGSGSPLWAAGAPLDDEWFDEAYFAGAFNTENWMIGWTALSEYGYLDETVDAGTDINVSGVITEDANWSSAEGNRYFLDGVVFVTGGATLTIDAGTEIYGREGQGNNASALVITQDGTIIANGTPDNGILFTSEKALTETLDETDRGEWGGVVILGSASTNNSTELKQVEGINEIATDPALAQYGGTEDNDNSGIFRYVSIRHTGINVGDQAGNEIQGLTLGGVGSGTTIEYVESFASGDDGFEWFGGTVNTKYLVSAFNADDSYDWDEGFRGMGQFWFAIQATDLAGRVAEMDGATGNENGMPFAKPILSNVTYIGAGVGATPEGDGEQMLIFRDNTGGEYWNSIFTEYDDQSSGLGITVEDIDNSGDKPLDSRQRFEAGDIALVNNFWYNFGAGNEITQFSDQDFVQNYLSDAANSNQVVDPELIGIGRTAGNMELDPRPGATSPVWFSSSDPGNDFFTEVTYSGAFGANQWMSGWTALSQMGYISEVSISNEEEIVEEDPTVITLSQNYPNPFNPSTNIEFSLPATERISLKVYDMLGREVATLINNEVISAGAQTISFDASNLSSGVYIYRLVSASSVITRKMTLIK